MLSVHSMARAPELRACEVTSCSPQYSEQSVCTFTYQFPSALQQVLHAEPQMTDRSPEYSEQRVRAFT